MGFNASVIDRSVFLYSLIDATNLVQTFGRRGVHPVYDTLKVYAFS